jgi:hypothetical protein
MKFLENSCLFEGRKRVHVGEEVQTGFIRAVCMDGYYKTIGNEYG